MKILYAFPEELPLQKARGIQACATTSALSQISTTYFVAPFKGCPFKAYGISAAPSLNKINLPRKLGPFKSVFLWALKLKILTLKLKPDIIFVRHPKLAYFLIKLNVSSLFFEVHEILKDKHPSKEKMEYLEKHIYNKAKGLIFISSGLKSRAEELYSFKAPSIIVPSGTFLCEACAFKKFVPQKIHDIYYVGTGHYSWKGLNILFKALERCPSITLHFVGPFEEKKLPTSIRNRICVYGWQKFSSIHKILEKAQIGVLPNTGESTVSRFYTSPMKLLDYMATKTAVVASDLPSVRELVSEKEVLFFAPDDPQSLAEALQLLSQNSKLRERLATAAYEKAKEFTWERRAQILYRFFRENL
ncbi:MAG TPA: glycosyltransferase [Thermodesulfobacteriaceae bacterium]|nr:glycosyltransferase [Thermodesulfobacteriaceae bacterium]